MLIKTGLARVFNKGFKSTPLVAFVYNAETGTYTPISKDNRYDLSSTSEKMRKVLHLCARPRFVAGTNNYFTIRMVYYILAVYILPLGVKLAGDDNEVDIFADNPDATSSDIASAKYVSLLNKKRTEHTKRGRDQADVPSPVCLLAESPEEPEEPEEREEPEEHEEPEEVDNSSRSKKSKNQ
jgi:hypothetical protein